MAAAARRRGGQDGLRALPHRSATYLIDGGLSQQSLLPGRLARLFADSGQVAVVALPAASAEARREARELHALAELPFLDVHIPDGEAPERTAERVLEALKAA